MTRPKRLMFQLVSSNQPDRFQNYTKQVETTYYRMANLLVEDVALTATKEYYGRAKATLARNLKRDVEQEIHRMAKAIGRGLTVQDKYRGPTGTLTMQGNYKDGPLSQKAEELGWSASFNRKNSGIFWPSRTPSYMSWKASQANLKDGGKPGKWFRNKGELEDWFKTKTGDDYQQMFGGVRVTFVRETKQPKILKGYGLTTTGMRGRPVFNAVVGRVRVVYLNKLQDPNILPGLSQTTGPLTKGGPSNGLPGAASLFPDSALSERSDVPIKTKLMRRSGKDTGRRYRPAIDPFLNFYLARAIPNAVWRRLERAPAASMFSRA